MLVSHLRQKKKTVREIEDDRAEQLFLLKKKVLEHEIQCRTMVAQHEMQCRSIEHELKVQVLQAKLRKLDNTSKQ